MPASRGPSMARPVCRDKYLVESMKIRSKEVLRERRRLSFRSTNELIARRKRLRKKIGLLVALFATLGTLAFKFE